MRRPRGEALIIGNGRGWGKGGTSGLEYLVAAGKALVTGTWPDVGHAPKVHGKAEL